MQTRELPCVCGTGLANIDIGSGGVIVMMGMDIAREGAVEKRRRRRWISGIGLSVVVAAISVFVWNLDPAAPSVDRDTVYLSTVERGAMLRQVRGHGSLVPVESRWIPAQTRGRINAIHQKLGARVEEDTIIIELSNPEVEQAAVDADTSLLRVRAELASLQMMLGIQELDRQTEMVSLEAENEEARLRAAADRALAEKGLLGDIQLQLSEQKVTTLEKRLAFAKRRLQLTIEANAAQLDAKRAEVEQQRTRAQLRESQREALLVRAGVAGVVQEIPFEVGEEVGPGANLAMVAEPSRLRAEVRIPATQAAELRLGQVAHVDTRSDVIEGKVARIDPNVRQGTVLVDIELEGRLPPGARPDLSIEGRIDIEMLDDVLFVDRPSAGAAFDRVDLFRLDSDDKNLERVEVELGRASVRSIEVVSGLRKGDQIIISDMRRYDEYDHLQFK